MCFTGSNIIINSIFLILTLSSEYISSIRCYRLGVYRMFSRNISAQYSYRKCLFIQCALTNYLKQIKCSSNITSVGPSLNYRWNTIFRPTRAFCTNNNSIIGVKGVYDGDKVDVGNISHLLESPRQTLHNMQAKVHNKIFDVHYKHNIVNHQGPKKKIQNKDWTCIYSFVWPEKMKFESTALSKHQAATNAATLALKWLYKMRRIDKRGSPVHDETILAEARSKLNDKIHATISDNSATRIERIWGDYENEIKSIYERTFKEAEQRLILPPLTISKDSTIDDEDDCEDGGITTEENVALNSERRVFNEKMKPPSQSTLAKRNEMLKKKFELYDEELTPLPIDQYVDQLATTVQNSRVTILVGAPGCGKSTRAPTAILRRLGANTTVIVSEPRKVAAIGLARRVASELSENVGESVGYQVRLDSKPPRQSCGTILYCTSGVLLKRLQMNPGLEGCSHVIIDEAHERDVNTDITLLLLKKALDINPNLKVMVMSATLDIGVFTRYFDSCPIVEVPGKTFPVQVSYLDEIQKKFQIKLPNTLANCSKEYGKPSVYCEEVVEVIKAVDKQGDEGAILVFLPGWAEIKQTKQLLDEYYRGGGPHLILPVHSRLSTTEQTKIFDIAMPGVRKIVLATNIAETSITIPDVTHVIDTGAHKENRMKDGTGVATLESVWVSQAGAKQRTGRAGRVQPGHCYRMYTNEKAMEFAPHTTPEILRIPLVQTALDCKSYAPEDKIESFLSQLPEPPTSKAIQFAVNDLKDLGALTREEHLTRVGVLLSRFSLHPRVGRGVLHAAVCGSLPSLAVTAAHCSAPAELFARALDRRDEIREIKKQFNKTSDHSALYLIQCEFERALAENGWRDVDQWCDKYGLRKDRLGFIKSLTKLYLEETLRSGVVHSATEAEELSRFSEIDEMSSAIFLSGCNCLLTTKRHVETKGKLKTVNKLFTSEGDRAHIGTESVNYGITKQTNKTNLLVYFDGYHSTDRRALVVYKTSLVTPQAVLLFSKGNIYRSDMDDDNETTILHLPRHRLKVQVPSSQADVILKAKEMIWNTFEYYIERDSRNIDYDEVTLVSRFKIRLFKAVAKILMEAHMEYIEGKNVQNYDAVEDEE